jgi:hypothetical protein
MILAISVIALTVALPSSVPVALFVLAMVVLAIAAI